MGKHELTYYNGSLAISIENSSRFTLFVAEDERYSEERIRDEHGIWSNQKNYPDYLINILYRLFPQDKDLISMIEREKQEITRSHTGGALSFMGGKNFNNFCAKILQKNYIYNKKNGLDNFYYTNDDDRRDNIKKSASKHKTNLEDLSQNSSFEEEAKMQTRIRKRR